MSQVGLPEFTNPPLVEVALLTQFATPAAYKEIFVRDIWDLFRGDFPVVQELVSAPPVFEVFGGTAQPNSFQFGLQLGPTRNRFWFLSSDDRELIQFQSDRFVHNWRKTRVNSNYPRYKNIIEKYRRELTALNDLFVRNGWGAIAANQSELTYLNHLPLVSPTGAKLSPSFYFRRIDPALMGDSDEFSIVLRKVIEWNNRPVARLFMESSLQQNPAGHQQVALNFTVRGPPETATVDGSLAFLDRAHKLILNTFVDVTSDAAQSMWGRTQ